MKLNAGPGTITADQLTVGSITADKITGGNNVATSPPQRGPGFLGLLTLLFVGLKLTDTIDWSWWLVLLPLWGPLALALAVVLFIVVPLALVAKKS